MSKTSASQKLASKRYYEAHQDEINERRREYYKLRNQAYYESIMRDDEKRLKRNEYYRNYRMRRKIEMVNKMICHELDTLNEFAKHS